MVPAVPDETTLLSVSSDVHVTLVAIIRLGIRLLHLSAPTATMDTINTR